MVKVTASVCRTIMDSMGIDMYGPGGCMCPQDNNGQFSIYMYGQGGCMCPQDHNGHDGYRHVLSRWLHVSTGP